MIRLPPFAREHLTVGLLLLIALSATLAATHVLIFSIPRPYFIALMAATTVALGALVFDLFYAPIRDKFYWELLPNGIILLLFSVAAIRLSTTGFSEDDEIYSWNVWAIEHYLGLQADFRFTVAPYPQLFSYWLAALYHGLGSVVVQSIPRFYLAIPTLIVGVSVIGMAKLKTWKSAALGSVIVFIVVAPVIPWYAKGLADPLMTAAIALSAWLLVDYSRNTKDLSKLVLALGCAVIGAVTKQAALVWCCISMPIIILVGCWRLQWPRVGLGLVAITVMASLIWPLWIASSFSDNQGVISASMGSRGYLEQLVYGCTEYLIKRPELFVLLAASAIASFRVAILRTFTLFAVLPMLVIWFLFGAYALRLGAHVLALSGILLMCALYGKNVEVMSESSTASCSGYFVAAVLFTIYIFAIVGGIAFIAPKIGINLKDGALSTLQVQFGQRSTSLIENILKNKLRVWVTSNYSYGPFFGRVPVGWPDYSIPNYSRETVKSELIKFHADYAIYSGEVPMGPASNLLKELAENCPEALTPVLMPPNQKGFILYNVNAIILAEPKCK